MILVDRADLLQTTLNFNQFFNDLFHDLLLILGKDDSVLKLDN